MRSTTFVEVEPPCTNENKKALGTFAQVEALWQHAKEESTLEAAVARGLQHEGLLMSNLFVALQPFDNTKLRQGEMQQCQNH